MSCMNTMMMHRRQDEEDYSEALDFAIEARAAELIDALGGEMKIAEGGEA